MGTIAVIGGGLAGLSAALHLTLREPEARVTLLEAAARAGGNARTLREHGYVIEQGPNAFLETPESRDLIDRLGLGPRVIEARAESRRRFIVRGGKLRQVPLSPPHLLFGNLLSLPGRLRVLREPWIRSHGEAEETVFDFARRRFGPEAAEVVDAAVAGITAGDSRALELASAFPMIAEMEQHHGSVVRGMIRARKHGARPRLVSFRAGMGDLIEAFESRLGDSLVTAARAKSVARDGDAWRIEIEHREPLRAGRVVIATPARAAAPMLRGLDSDLARELGAIPFRGLSVVSLGYPLASIGRPLSGYGYLIPSSEEAHSMGAVWESSLFDGRAPEGRALIRVMMGGERDPRAAYESEASLLTRAEDDLARLLGIQAAPEHFWVSRSPDAIAQYVPGHLARIERIRAAEARHPGLVLCGTSYEGLSVGAAIASGAKAAAAVNEFSESSAAATVGATS
ncbi:MAG TPA: protoporphyrinogen oxidase [Candidatus Udaeobacter sp.]|nr:protoporphyrinogen oxidase [Candidatus Udaeobacter sp.]